MGVSVPENELKLLSEVQSWIGMDCNKCITLPWLGFDICEREDQKNKKEKVKGELFQGCKLTSLVCFACLDVLCVECLLWLCEACMIE